MQTLKERLDYALQLAERFAGRYDPEFASAAAFALFKLGETATRGSITVAVRNEIRTELRRNKRQVQTEDVDSLDRLPAKPPKVALSEAVRNPLLAEHLLEGKSVTELAARCNSTVYRTKRRLRAAATELLRTWEG